MNMNKSVLLLVLLLTSTLSMRAQQDTISTTAPSPLSFSGYADIYYSYDIGDPGNHQRPGFFYSYNRHHEVNLNLAYVKATYQKDRVRGNLALMAGTYAQFNLAAEPDLLQSVFEANVGVKLSKDRELWLDAGVMPSHIGFESAIGKDCWNLTRSILAENSPYYEAGARLGYTSPNGKWYLAGLFLNGWQRIARVPENMTPALGSQLTFKPSGNTTINWSTFVGNDKPDSVGQMRVFNNFYAVLQPTDRFGVTLGFDIGMEEAASGDSSSTWMSPVIIPRFKINDKTCVAARWELYQDEDGVIIATGTEHGFNTMGYSLNFDRWITPNVIWRIEARMLQSKDKIFADADGEATETNTFFTTTIAIALP